MRFVLANVLLFLSLSGILYYQYFFQSPSAPVVAGAASQLRSPAATPAELPLLLPRKSLTEKAANDPDWKYSLNCKNSEQSISTQSMGSEKDFLILNIKKCEKEFPNAMVIENESNGFTASVFAVTTSYSKTDAIPLKKGKNVIVIKYQLAKVKVDAKSDIIERIILEH